VRAIDTNVIVRLLTADDADQAKASRRAIEAGNIFVPLTVCLETEWVLRCGYGFAADQIAKGLAGLAGLPGVFVEQPALLSRAIAWLAQGMDFADALHLAKSDGCEAFLSFDKRLAKVALARSPVPVQTP
jgi:predicted nucleic-acid-binding protein